MNSLEARAQAFEIQKARWLKLSLDTRKSIEDDEIGVKSNRKPIKGWEF